MTTPLRRWSLWAIAAAMVAPAGCGQPPPMVPMTPAGVGGDPLAVNFEDDQYKAKALGETPASRESTVATSIPEPDDMPRIVREPTEPGEEVELENGLRYTTLKAGDPEGPMAELGRSVSVFYRGTLADGTEFDSNMGRQPVDFPLNPGSLIQGWIDGIPGMRVGERRRLVIPAKLGYGDRGSPPKIPPGAELTFEVELVGVR
ncbi:FKBP-type peptidyl-prolyl cis-trans isomerase [Tautonia rosea]|uniref:FKBP-type peptidyl-prolyl cis-trans isomerase n=1 Tax=Tautonia rosea TaxID=2728037 RepID=UPI00147643E0|nr:FKBP-type peptidyl-prolyl cis-trans isomerase [Tautonia rosea]